RRLSSTLSRQTSPCALPPCLLLTFFFLLPRQPPKSTLFPYTTLFRSVIKPNINSGAHFAVFVIFIKDSLGIFCSRQFIPEIFIIDRKSTRLNSSHVKISYAVFCLKKKNKDATSEALATAIGDVRLNWL